VNGDRLWTEAGAERVGELTDELRRRAKNIREAVEVDAVHDMRTATRRLRTTLELYAGEARKKDRKAVEDGLRGIARRLGAVRDLDVLLGTLSAASSGDGDAIDRRDLGPLRRAWERERKRGARRLLRELEPRVLRGVLARAERLIEPGTRGAVVDRVAGRAPGLIWTAYGALLAYEIDSMTADPSIIHRMRITAKQLRYTLEAFEEALVPGATLIEEVTAVHDAAGEMHDSIVARDRARSLLAGNRLEHSERTAIQEYADGADRRADACRPVVAQALTTVRGRRFRISLGRAVARMGHVAPEEQEP
jgi:CHAD domain-containing protein